MEVTEKIGLERLDVLTESERKDLRNERRLRAERTEHTSSTGMVVSVLSTVLGKPDWKSRLTKRGRMS